MPRIQNIDIKYERKKKPGLCNFPSGRRTRIDLSSLSGRHVHVSWITQAWPAADPTPWTASSPPILPSALLGHTGQSARLAYTVTYPCRMPETRQMPPDTSNSNPLRSPPPTSTSLLHFSATPWALQDQTPQPPLSSSPSSATKLATSFSDKVHLHAAEHQI